MGSSTPATTNTTQNQKTDPWSAATPMLQNLINQYQGINTSTTGNQTDAASSLVSAANSIPNLTPQATNAVTNMFNTNTQPQAGMLTNAFDSLQNNLGNTASGANLNPYDTPGFSDALKTSMQDITNQVKGVYAGSGRAPSGAGSFAQSLGRGLTQGIAPTIASQFNTNTQNMLGANSTLFGGAGSTASGVTAQNQVPLTNAMAGLQAAGMLPGLITQPAQTALNASNIQAQLPYANLSPMLQAGTALGGMGSTSAGTGTTTQQAANNPMMNIMGGILGGAGLMFSDRTMKDDIEEVGKLHDGQKVYRFRMKGSKTPQIGLIAQEVAEHEPAAVHQIGDKLAVNYRTATNRAAAKAGMLRKAA